MKIGLVSPYDFAYPGGANAHVSLLTREFLKRGHSVKIIAPSSKSVEMLGVENFIRLGVPIPIPANGSLARVSSSFWLTPKVKHLLETENFDVIHLHEPMASVLSLVVLKHSRALNIGTFHSFWPKPTYRHKFLKPFLQSHFDRLHGKIAVSKPAGEFINKIFPSNYAIIPNPIDTDHFSKLCPPVEEFQDGKVNILFVGRMEKRKGLSYLLKAYSRIKWDYPETRLLLVGSQSLDKESYRIIGERALQDVVLCGAVPYSDLPRYYQAADIFCAPNIGRESFGMVIAEAIKAAGATDGPGTQRRLRTPERSSKVAGRHPGASPSTSSSTGSPSASPTDHSASLRTRRRRSECSLASRSSGRRPSGSQAGRATGSRTASRSALAS